MLKRDIKRGIALLGSFMVFVSSTHAFSEEPSPKNKHWGGSLVDYILHVPEVVKWEEYEKSLDPKVEFSAWGEGIGQVDSRECSYIGLGMTQDGKVKTLKHFCISNGGELWIQKAAPVGSDEGPSYVHYEAWLAECKPTADSYGQC